MTGRRSPPAFARRTAIGLLALALILRVGVVIATPHYRPVHDDRDYDRIACWIALHGLPPARVPRYPGPATCALTRAQSLRARRRPLGGLTAYRPPLWPLALGATYAVAGELPLARWTAGRLLQALLGVTTVALIGAITARVWDWRIALVATALAAGFIPLWLDGATLISEPLFTALELAAVLAALRYREPPRRLRHAAAAGVFVGLAALTRSTGIVLIVPFLAAVWTRPPGRRLRPGLAPAVLAACAVLVIAPWTVRNALVLHAFVPVSTETGPTLLGTYNSASRDSRHCPGCWVLLSSRRRFRALSHRLQRLGEVQRDRLARSLTVRFIRAHPLFPAQVAWQNSLRLLELGGRARTRFTARTIDVPPGAAVVGADQLWIVAVLAMVGAAAAVRRPPPRWLIGLAVILWVATVLVQSETPRFRAALDPFLLMLAAHGIAATVGRLRTARARPAPVAS